MANIYIVDLENDVSFCQVYNLNEIAHNPGKIGTVKDTNLGCDGRGTNVSRTEMDKRKRSGTQGTTWRLKSEGDIHERDNWRNKQSANGFVHLRLLSWLIKMTKASPTWTNSNDDVNVMGFHIVIQNVSKGIFGGRKINGYVDCKSFKKLADMNFLSFINCT